VSKIFNVELHIKVKKDLPGRRKKMVLDE